MSFKVLIDDVRDHYLPGHCVVGRIYYSARDPHFVEARVKLVGEEYTHYTSPATMSQVSSDRGWKCTFLETKNILIRSGELNTGEFQFPFNLTLPRRLPSSYSGKYGYVKFFLKASLDRYNDRYEDEIEFKVFSPIDLNDKVNLWLAPSTHSDELQVHRWLCIHEEIDLEVKLERNAFILGEAVNVVVVVMNSSGLTVSAVRVKLILKVQALVATPRQEFLSVHEVLASDKESGVGAYREKSFSFKLMVPHTIDLPNFDKCSLYTQSASLEAVALIRNASKPNLKVEVALVLGHFPVEGQDMSAKTTQSLIRNVRGREHLPDPAIIRPLPYGINNLPPDSPKVVSKMSPSYPPTPQKNVVQPLHNIYTNPLPPYPTSTSSKLFLPGIPSNPASLSSTFDDVQVPMGVYEAKKSALEPLSSRRNKVPSQTTKVPRNSNNSLHSPKNLPCSSVEPFSYPNNNCPYPTDDCMSPPPHCPYPVVGNNCPYPTEQSKVERPYFPSRNSDSKDTGLPTKMPMPSNHDGTIDSTPLIVRNPPYPLEDDSNAELRTKMPMPSGSARTSFEESNPSYLTSIKGSFEEVGPPYPVLQKDTNPPYPVLDSTPNKSNPPYPTSSSLSIADNTAPYPPENPHPHSSLGFPTMMQMPMPSNSSPLPCDSIGFAVPTSSNPEGIQSVPSVTNNFEEDTQPSAPLPTPPIAAIEEVEERVLVASDVPSPIILPSINNSKSSVRSSASSSSILDLPTPPVHDVEELHMELLPSTISSIAPPTYEEILSALNKKKNRSKRERELAS